MIEKYALKINYDY